MPAILGLALVLLLLRLPDASDSVLLSLGDSVVVTGSVVVPWMSQALEIRQRMRNREGETIKRHKEKKIENGVFSVDGVRSDVSISLQQYCPGVRGHDLEMSETKLTIKAAPSWRAR